MKGRRQTGRIEIRLGKETVIQEKLGKPLIQEAKKIIRDITGKENQEILALIISLEVLIIRRENLRLRKAATILRGKLIILQRNLLRQKVHIIRQEEDHQARRIILQADRRHREVLRRQEAAVTIPAEEGDKIKNEKISYKNITGSFNPFFKRMLYRYVES